MTPGSRLAARITYDPTSHGGTTVGSSAQKFLIDVWVWPVKKPLADNLVAKTCVVFMEDVALGLLRIRLSKGKDSEKPWIKPLKAYWLDEEQENARLEVNAIGEPNVVYSSRWFMCSLEISVAMIHGKKRYLAELLNSRINVPHCAARKPLRRDGLSGFEFTVYPRRFIEAELP